MGYNGLNGPLRRLFKLHLSYYRSIKFNYVTSQKIKNNKSLLNSGSTLYTVCFTLPTQGVSQG